MIYGIPDDRNMIRLVRWINRWPVLPMFGNGRSLQQPIHVTDVAWAVVQLLDSPATITRQFNISGAEPLTYNDVGRFTAKALVWRILCLHIPACPVVFLLDFLEKSGITLPIKAEQIRRLNEDRAFSYADPREAFCFAPVNFQEVISEEIRLFRLSCDGF